MNKILSIVVIAVLMTGMSGCVFGASGKADGNLIGTVVREGTGELINRPAMIIGRVLKNPTVPDQQFFGDAEGKFEITLPGGNYKVQVSSNESGPYFEIPDPITVEENRTTVVLLKVPDGF